MCGEGRRHCREGGGEVSIEQAKLARRRHRRAADGSRKTTVPYILYLPRSLGRGSPATSGGARHFPCRGQNPWSSFPRSRGPRRRSGPSPARQRNGVAGACVDRDRFPLHGEIDQRVERVVPQSATTTFSIPGVEIADQFGRRSCVIGRGVVTFSIWSAMALASATPTQMGRTLEPSLSRRMTIGRLVAGSIMSVFTVISICMATSLPAVSRR